MNVPYPSYFPFIIRPFTIRQDGIRRLQIVKTSMLELAIIYSSLFPHVYTSLSLISTSDVRNIVKNH